MIRVRNPNSCQKSDTVYIDLEEYHINNAGKILGILMHMAEGTYATLPA